ncbi:hypothetical protein HCUR_00839 [Holospora curviuscula]|uniref:Uncharacterized protein n=2 Tax=Holospora curviuscula TaxID=1082868 RepID=A0A2S5R8S0_9PROT|nr:hypothetical protein HCUR_00839 [Holospora curviuscula]
MDTYFQPKISLLSIFRFFVKNKKGYLRSGVDTELCLRGATMFTWLKVQSFLMGMIEDKRDFNFLMTPQIRELSMLTPIKLVVYSLGSKAAP